MKHLISLRAALVAGLLFFGLFGTAHAQLVFHSKPGFYIKLDQMPIRGGSGHFGFSGTIGYRISDQHAIEAGFSQDKYWRNKYRVYDIDTEADNNLSLRHVDLAYTFLKPIRDSKWKLQFKAAATVSVSDGFSENNSWSNKQLVINQKYDVSILRTFDLSKKVQGLAGVGLYYAVCNTPSIQGTQFNPNCPTGLGLEAPIGVSFPFLKRRASLTSSLSINNKPSFEAPAPRTLVMRKTTFSINF